MNVTFIRQWIVALRSGEYLQTLGVHKKGESYCAIGLGYKLCPGHQWKPLSSIGEVAIEGAIVPKTLVQMTGLPVSELLKIALSLNDSKKTFAQIADHLESLLPNETFAQDLYQRLLHQSVAEVA